MRSNTNGNINDVIEEFGNLHITSGWLRHGFFELPGRVADGLRAQGNTGEI